MNFLGIDLGTSSIKAVLYNQKFNVITVESDTYDIIQPKNGWAEQDPMDWVNALDKILTNLNLKQSYEMKRVKSIGLTGQMHGLVMLDENNSVLRNAILWLDQRSFKEVDDITEKLGYDYILSKTANPISSGFTLSKLQWVRNNEPQIFKKCKKILLPKDYIRFYLTGDFATDVSDASGMQMLNIENRNWDFDLLKKMDISEDILPKVYESIDITGYLKKSVVKKYGFSKDVSVIAGAGDNAAAAIGCGVIKDGKAFTTIGTSGVVYVHTSEMLVDYKGRYHTFCSAVPGEWHVMGVTQAAGLSINWIKNQFYKNDKFDKVNRDIEGVDIGADKLIYLPYLMGERSPHLDPFARGTFIGLSNTHTRKEIARSVYEGVVFSLRDCLEVIEESGRIDLKEMLLTGGGAESRVLCRIISDNFNVPSYTLDKGVGTTLGVAILASVASNCYSDLESAINEAVIINNKYECNQDNFNIYSKYFNIYKNAYISLKNIYRNLQEI